MYSKWKERNAKSRRDWKCEEKSACQSEKDALALQCQSEEKALKGSFWLCYARSLAGRQKSGILGKW